ncbi:MAG: Dabb family protein [Lachnospiraceae bacterium]
MVNHTVLWQLKESYTAQEKQEIKAKIKQGLEGLTGVIPGLISATVEIEPLVATNFDLALISTFESKEALLAYQENPAHLEVAGFVRSVVQNRASIDYVC